VQRRLSAILLAAGACTLVSIGFHPAAVPLLADNNPGKEVFERRCTGCHALDEDKAGPHLRGIFGKPAGSAPSYPYSQAIRNSRVVWDDGTLDKWLTDTDEFIPDNDMAFRVTKPEERTAIIEYLKQVSRK
jgi:cytochrome c